ncbi:MAG TPA: PAS domain S-box protein [Candidatus Limnocylindrales bacterium]|jgi:PAS domain S-box-containing protein|nr:PAS domain S-box protein [Candidatus Limnocylindrales bacterium]
MSVPYRVLLIEDSPQDAFLNLRALERGGMEVQAERVETMAQLKAALERGSWDLVLCDYQMPGFNGLGALSLYKGSGLDVPFIVVSGQIGEEQAVKLIKAGAHDYIMKDNLAQLAPAVKRELLAAEERWIRQRAQATESFLASLVRHCDDAIIGEMLNGQIVSWNAGAQRLYGYTASEIMGQSASILESPYRPTEQAGILERLKREEQVPRFETVHLRKNGTAVEVSITVSPIKEPRGRIIGVSTLARDISQRKREEGDRLTLIQDLASALARTAAQDEEAPASSESRNLEAKPVGSE